MKDLLGRGYFPAELPPPFQTKEFAEYVSKTPPTANPYIIAAGKTPNYVSVPATYNLARAGSLRRVLSIPNPINFFQLSELLEKNWNNLNKHYNKSHKALSRPIRGVLPISTRAYEWNQKFADIPVERSAIRAGMRYSLSIDIKSLYPSIYTHSIAWAMHGKKVAQSNTNYDDLFANKIDRLIQNSQSKQTKGIPIGPDTSFLAAEVILSAIDQKLKKDIGKRYFRYLDDYEFCFKTPTEAESALSAFQEIIGTFELFANEGKTKIDELPALLENPWLRKLRAFTISGPEKENRQKTDLFDFFNLSVELWRQFPQEAVLRYAVTKTSGTMVCAACWKLYQELLCQWALAEPAVLPIVLDIFLVYKNTGHTLDCDAIGELLSTIIFIHAPKGHTSEVAWALWAYLILRITIDSSIVATLCKIDNPIVALLFLHAKEEKLLSTKNTLKLWKEKMSPDQLREHNWLLAYEARVKKWLPPTGAKEYIKTVEGFGYLGSANISFYDKNAIKTYKPKDLKFIALKLSMRHGAGYV